MKNYPLSRRSALVVQEMDGETLIYDLVANKAFCLNETSALVWQASDGTKTAAEISRIISLKLKTPVNEDFVWLAIDQLKKEKLIENEAELDNYFAGISRREVIKKVGLGTMIALPLVASVVVPTAIEAQSLSCMVCISFQMGDVCGACNNTVGNCFENSNCGMGQLTAGVTCANCQLAVGSCAGGVNTCSWTV